MTEARVLHWRINCFCNRKCPFCYGPQNKAELDYEAAAPVVEKLIDFGVRSFVLTGGEPLLSKKIDRVFALIHGLGATLAVYTNCDYFDFHEEAILENVDTLCLPVDGASEFTHDRVRGKDNFRAVISVLDRYAHGQIKFKVGTVLGRHNMHELEAIRYTLDRYRLENWKLYEYLRYEDRDLQKDWDSEQLGISDTEYRAAAERLLNMQQSKTKVLLSSQYDRANSYFMMNPDLEIILPMRRENGIFEDVPLCDARTTSAADIEREWLNRVDSHAYSENVRKTFAL